MLSIFRGKPLDQALSVEKYKELLTKSYKEILLYEIDANKASYIKNNNVTNKGNKRYLQGVGLTTIAILISIILLLSNTFMAIEKSPTKVQVVNPSVESKRWVIYDIKGTKLISTNFTILDGKPLSVDISPLANGLYFAEIDHASHKFMTQDN